MKPELVLLVLFLGLSSSGINGQSLFSNPILDRNSADPGIMRLGDFYYLTLSEKTETELTIYKSPVLTNFREAESRVAFVAPPGFQNVWASEMHLVNGELYIYFTMDGNGQSHFMYVIKANDPTNPMGNWSSAVKLMPEWEGAIDGTPFQHGDGKLYFVWASWAFGPLTLYIAPMESPTVVGEPRIQLRNTPSADWECHGGCTNEGAYFIYNQNVSYMVFSASSTWDPNYCLSYMSIEASKNPMDVDNWDSVDGPVFSRNDEESVFTTGHASFTTSPDGTETWMAYHATVNPVDIDGYRIARVEKIGWNQDGTPNFPRPHGYDSQQTVPGGQELLAGSTK